MQEEIENYEKIIKELNDITKMAKEIKKENTIRTFIRWFFITTISISLFFLLFTGLAVDCLSYKENNITTNTSVDGENNTVSIGGIQNERED